ncbi:MAG: hypothetical protein Alpg2KO_31910 [Alphaproteobacteria bacterium]
MIADWHLRGFLLACFCTGIWLFRHRQISSKGLVIALVIGLIADQAEAPEALASALSSLDLLPDRIAMFSGAILVIIMGFVMGCGLLAASTRRRHRSRDRVVTGCVLVVITSLLWGYHVLLINGWLLAEIETDASRALQVLSIGGDDHSAFMTACQQLDYECQTGPATGRISHSSEHLSNLATGWLESTRDGLQQPGDPLSFTLADGLATPQYPFAMAYAERGGQYRMAIDLAGPRVSFDSSRISFFVIANVATVFWVILGGLVIHLHKPRKPRPRSSETG